MKRAALLTVAMLCVASLVFAQGGTIGAFSDMGGTDCYITDGVAGLLPIYIVHVNTPGATASQFYAPTPACMVGATFLSDSPSFPVAIGGSQTGIAIAYGACLSAPIHVLTIQYFAAGLTSPCCYFDVLPDPAVPSGQIEVVDCVETIVFATGQSGLINTDGTCECGVPTQDTTWGKMKSLYSE
jgi:hypothetical protein